MPPGIIYRQGLAYRQMGRNDQAIACFAQACQSPDAGSDQYFQLAEARQSVGDFANARLALQEGLRRNPDHEGCKYLLVKLAQYSGELSGVQRY